MTQYPTAPPPFPGKEWILDEIGDLLEGSEELSLGSHVSRFEEEFAGYVGRDLGIATNSCTAALEATLRALDVSGQEVIVPVQTFFSTGAAVVNEGGEPVFADIDPGHLCLSIESVRDRITHDTAAVIVVYFGGFIPPEMSALSTLCERYNATLIEDAAHAHGAARNGTRAGAFGDVGCFSFYATKNMTTGEGGMIVTDDVDLAEQTSSIRNRGIDLNADRRQYSNFGSNYRMSEIAAILGRSQLEHLDDFIDHRNAVAERYHQAFSDLIDKGVLDVVGRDPACRHAYWRYTIKLAEAIDRERVRETLAEEDFAIDWAYPPLHLQPVFREHLDTHEGMAPIAEDVLARHLCLPVHLGIQPDDVPAIVEALVRALPDRLLGD